MLDTPFCTLHIRGSLKRQKCHLAVPELFALQLIGVGVEGNNLKLGCHRVCFKKDGRFLRITPEKAPATSRF